MTNQLDSLLQAVEDALEEGEVQLWQPDLTDLVLPGDRNFQADAALENRIPGSRWAEPDALPRLAQAVEEGTQASGDASGEGHSFPREAATRVSSPALLEQLNALDDTQAGVEALSRAQARDQSPSTRTGAGESGGGVQYDPAALRDFPLAAAAAAAQQEEDARAVDRVFQRDSRRYDRGFSLY